MIDISAWGWPQVAYLLLISLSLGSNLAKHGDPAQNVSIWRALLAASIMLPILAFGGFFS